MEYLNNTIVYLQQENKELKQQLRRMTDLQNIINQQRNDDKQLTLNRLHQQQIKVIRQIASDTEKMLRREIRKLNDQVKEISQTLEKEYEVVLKLKRDYQTMKIQKEDIEQQNANYRQCIADLTQKFEIVKQDSVRKQQYLRKEYMKRQQQIIQKYIQKLDDYKESNEKEMNSKEEFINSQNRKMQIVYQQKSIIQQQLRRIVLTLQEEQQRKLVKNKCNFEQLKHLRKQNDQLKANLKQMDFKIFQIRQQLKSQTSKNIKLQQEMKVLKEKNDQMIRTKERQIEKQRMRALSACKQLSNHQKFIKNQQQLQKKKDKQFNQSTKMLLHKIKEIQTKTECYKSTNTSFLDKTTVKTSKKEFQTYQSISLDNSFNRDSPSVSCFLKNQKLQEQGLLKKKALKIITNNNENFLKLNDLDTPCFESAKERGIKKTIKIRK